MSRAYRPEIDGLRAIAVVMVVLFHADFPGFSKGFIGVDIFFVISGFLITSIIADQQLKGQYSYRAFVVRRVRRILPALLVVMLTCIPFAYWLLLPDPLENFGQSLVATAFSANNILLWLTSGYWDLSSEYKPLLHTWSLGVEEQFYILYPLILISALKLPLKACYTVLASMAVLSFVLMVRSLSIDAEAAFFLLHYRAWQLLIGGIAGLMSLRSGFGDDQKLAIIGLMLILSSMVSWPLVQFSESITLSLATSGAALYLIWATDRGPVTWLLTRRSIVFIGLTSYSFYLWHQPVLAFLRAYSLEHPNFAQLSLGILVSFGLGILSWKFVERPFRNPKTTTNPVFCGFIGTSIVSTVVIGLLMNFSGGFPHRLNYDNENGLAGTSIKYNERIRRLLPQHPSLEDQGEPVVLIAGNSFARDFANVIIEAGLDSEFELLYRDDLSHCSTEWSNDDKALVFALDMLVYASGYYDRACETETMRTTDAAGILVKFAGPKHFGENLNPLIRYTPEERANQRLRVPEFTQEINLKNKTFFQESYVDLFEVLSDDGGRTIRATDGQGVLLTTDRVHFSQAGAVFVSKMLKKIIPELYVLSNQGSLDGDDF